MGHMDLHHPHDVNSDTRQKRVLILGAGVYQVPLIKKSREMGFYTIICSIRGNYPGFQYADKYSYTNTVDKEAVLQLARKEKIDAILTTGTDVAVSTIGYVCDQLGLKGITEQSAAWVTNKLEMKRRFEAGGVRTAEFTSVRTLEEAYAAFDALPKPVIFKSVDMSGSRGISRVDLEGQVPEAFRFSMENTHCDYIVVEHFLEGHEIGVDGYIDGDRAFIVPHDKFVYNNGSTNVPLGHVFPYHCDATLKVDIEAQILKSLRALKLTRAFFNADVMICGNRSYIIELGARCGATCIPELISTRYGFDYYEQMLNSALGLAVDMPQTPKCVSMGQLLVSEASGVIEALRVDPLPQNVDEIVLDYNVGDAVRRFRVGPDRIGHVIAHGSDEKEARINLERGKAAVHLCLRDTP